MRLYYNGRTITDLKKFLEDKVKQEELQTLHPSISEEEKKELMYEKCEEDALEEHL
jgi:hypothetical protein